MNILAARLYEPLLGRVLAPLRQEMLRMCPPLPRRRVLDLCCGPGGFTRLVARNNLSVLGKKLSVFGPDPSVLGADMDARMLAEAQRRTTGPCPQWVQADAQKLPFASQSFDLAVLCLALHSMPPHMATATLQEARRVAPQIMVADFCLAERNMHCPGVYLAKIIERMVGGEHYRCYQHYMKQGALEGLLHQQQLHAQQRHSSLAGAVTIALCDC